MFKVDIIAVSRIRKGAYADLVTEYSSRIRWSLKIHEIEARNTEPEKKPEEAKRDIPPPI